MPAVSVHVGPKAMPCEDGHLPVHTSARDYATQFPQIPPDVSHRWLAAVHRLSPVFYGLNLAQW
jgi:hypothetical protein